jgi:hypothetical protein
MQVTFFGTDVDLLTVAGWLLETPGTSLFEAASRPDQPNRVFSSRDEVAGLLEESARGFSAWSEAVGAPPRARYVEFEPNTRRRSKALGRTLLDSPAMIGIHRNSDQNGCLAAAYITCWSEIGARQRSIYSEDFLNEVNWKVFRSTVSRLQRTLKKSAPAKLRSYPIMEDAFEKLRRGQLELWNWGSPCAYPSPLIAKG